MTEDFDEDGFITLRGIFKAEAGIPLITRDNKILNTKKTVSKEPCEDCKRLRRELTWFGDPPKCWKHRKLWRPDIHG